ncbi:MAG: hypothetical protein ABJK20_11360 [Halieaceae bacterium]
MTDIFVIRNQLGHYWGKGKQWVDGSEPKTVMKLKHNDEAVNTLVELSSRDIELRGEIIEVELNSRGEPKVEASDIPLPNAEEADSEGEDNAEPEAAQPEAGAPESA